MAHPLVEQLRFARNEFQRALRDITVEEGNRHFGSMNSAGWIVGHLASQEQFYWHLMAQGNVVAPEVIACATGKPMSTPPMDEMWRHWEALTEAANPYLDTLTNEHLLTRFNNPDTGQPWRENVGTMLLRQTYHYWFHIGESQAIRQLLGHTDLPNFVGAFGDTPYRPADDTPVS